MNSKRTTLTMAPLTDILQDTFTAIDDEVASYEHELAIQENGTIRSIRQSIVIASGLSTVESQELVRFEDGTPGLAFDLQPESTGIVLLDASDDLEAGMSVERTGRVLSVPVGEDLVGRVVNGLGRPIDDNGSLDSKNQKPVEEPAPPIIERAPVTVALQSGIKAVDALIPIGRGQRELIVGDRQTGKTAIALDTIINQKNFDVICIYCVIGQQRAAVARFIELLRQHDAMDYSIVVAATADDVPGMQYVAPYAATSIAEHFRDNGRDALIVYDDLTSHARAYREISLLLERPPGREAYPGDIFFIHSRLLERSTHLVDDRGGGSLTALPIIETQAQNISAYIPTNLISITDGQIYLSPDLFRKGQLPAIDVGKSVSRVGGKTQLPAYREVAGDLKLSYSQFEELERFSRFGAQLDEETTAKLERGRRVREVLKQAQAEPIPAAEQVAVLLAVTEGVYDDLEIGEIEEANQQIRDAIRDLDDIKSAIESGEELSDEQKEKLTDALHAAVKED